jgi:hypothetical protein
MTGKSGWSGGQKLAAGESGFDFVPVGQGILTQLPAQEYLVSIHHVGKVHQAAMDVLNLNAQLGYLPEYLLKAHIGLKIRNGLITASAVVLGFLARLVVTRRADLYGVTKIVQFLESSP